LSKRGVLTLTLGLGTIGLIVLGVFLGDFLKIRNIIIENGERITTDDVLQMIDIQIGDSLLDADFNDASNRLQQHSWIRSANISIRFPNVHIKLEERLPFVVIQLPEQGPMWCDEEGYVLTPFVEAESTKNILMIEGLGPSKLTDSGAQAGSDRAWAIVRLLLRSDLGIFSSLKTIRFHAGGADLLNDVGQTLRLPWERTSRAIRRFQAVWPFLAETAIKNLDVRFPGEIIYQ